MDLIQFTIQKIPSLQNFMKIQPEGVELFYANGWADGRMDGQADAWLDGQRAINVAKNNPLQCEI